METRKSRLSHIASKLKSRERERVNVCIRETHTISSLLWFHIHILFLHLTFSSPFPLPSSVLAKRAVAFA